MDDREQKIQRLKEYFEKRGDVVMAFLFGSQAERQVHTESDWDIAVYFKPEVERVEWEEHASRATEPGLAHCAARSPPYTFGHAAYLL